MMLDNKELSKELVVKAMQCENSEELIALAKTKGVELTKEEAEAYLAELSDMELDDNTLKNVAGGSCWNNICADELCQTYTTH